jgi:hypothetical protein
VLWREISIFNSRSLDTCTSLYSTLNSSSFTNLTLHVQFFFYLRDLSRFLSPMLSLLFTQASGKDKITHVQNQAVSLWGFCESRVATVLATTRTPDCRTPRPAQASTASSTSRRSPPDMGHP